jgi:hypothetical protein
MSVFIPFLTWTENMAWQTHIIPALNPYCGPTECLTERVISPLNVYLKTDDGNLSNNTDIISVSENGQCSEMILI